VIIHLLHSVHTGSEAQPASYSTGTGVVSQALNGRSVKMLASIQYQGKKKYVDVYLHSPYLFIAWHVP
jgi:hypothetical protein